MIITLDKAIVHIIAPGIDTSVYSAKEIDTKDAGTVAFIISHIERLYHGANLRKGVFASNSGFKYHINEYKNERISFVEFSKAIAEKLQEGISQGEVALASDIIVSQCVIAERRYIVVLKCDNKSAMSHRVVAEGSDIKNEIVHCHEILPSPTRSLGECAFIDLDDFSIRFKGKTVLVDGEKLNLMSDVLLECESEMSVSETYRKVQSIAKKVSENYGKDTVETDALIKKAVLEKPEEETVEISDICETVFSSVPAAKAEFNENLRKSCVPETMEKVEYITKKANKKIKILTNTEIEISMPAEFYKDGDNVIITHEEDGTISIQLKNIREIINKS